jgi:hypothetical protein
MAKQPAPETWENDESEIARSLLAYLRRHPLAADTLRGISNWWLPQQRYRDDRPRIGYVLDRLVAEGVLHRDELPDGEVLYALNRHTKPLH